MVFRGPPRAKGGTRYYSKAREQWKERARLYALRRGPRCGGREWERLKSQVDVPGDFAIGVREMGDVGGGCDGNGIAKAVMDMAGPEERCEQAEGGH